MLVQTNKCQCSCKTGQAYFKVFLGVFLATTLFLLGLQLFLVSVSTSGSLIALWILPIIGLNTIPAYCITQTLLALLPKPRGIPQLNKLQTNPRVALLYLVRNDCVPEALTMLCQQNYANHKVFILDDSDHPGLSLPDTLKKATIVRRSTRHGNKAGNLNNWLRGYGCAYDYYVVLDSDSVLPPDFLSDALLYAEHPENAKVAVFESDIEVRPAGSAFSRILAKIEQLNTYIRYRVDDNYTTLFSVGHNNLCRTRVVMSAGGYDERCISEDYALSLALLKRGFHTRMIPIKSFEGCPDNIRSFSRRTVRWAKGLIEVVKMHWRGTPLWAKFHLAIRAGFYLVWLGLLPLMVLYLGVALGLPQMSVAGTIISDEVSLRMLLIWPAIVLFLLGIARSVVGKKAGQSAKQILEGQWLLVSVGYYSMMPLVQGVLKASFAKRQTFEVTMKNPRHIQAKQIAQDMWCVGLLSLTGIVATIYEPSRAIFALPWLLAIVSSPLCLIICHSKSSR